MKNKGFTLMEVLATISILSIIMVTATMKVMDVIENSKKEAFKLSIANISKIANLEYSKEFIEDETIGDRVVFTFSNSVISSDAPGFNLVFNGEIPKEGSLIIKLDGSVAYNVYNGTFCVNKSFIEIKATATRTTLNDCIKEIFKPSIVFSGGDIINHEINTAYTDTTIVYDTMGNPTLNFTKVIKFNGTPTASINTALKGVYTVDYTATEDGYTSLKTKTINVVDTIKPIIIGAINITITGAQVASFNPMTGISVTDNSLEAITPTFDTYALSGIGIFYITYRAVDSSGNTATPVSREITVIDSTNPTFVFGANGNATYGTTRNTTVTASDPESGVQIATLEYQWTTSTTAPTLASFTLPFTNGGTITTPAGVTGTYYLWVTATDQAGNNAIIRTNVFNLDNTIPIVTFGTNGNGTYAKTRSTTVTITDANSGVLTSSLEYQWTTSTTAPTEASFTIAFTNGTTITTPAGVTGTYYLWILSKDNATNTTIVRTNAFYLDNTIPVITLLGVSPTNITVGSAYTDAGATATDNISGNITGSISAISTVVIGTIGTYTVTYNVTDAYGNDATPVVRTVVVKPYDTIYIAGNGSGSFFVLANGAVKAIGYNGNGQLGDGTTTNKTSLFTISSLANVKQVSSSSHTLFLMTNGTVKAVGNNEYAQMGDGSFASKTTPVVISGVTGVKKVVATPYASFFLLESGGVMASGLNSSGQFGVGGKGSTATSPFVLSGITNIKDIEAGSEWTLFLSNDGTVKASGYNTDGQLGDGTGLSKINATVIPGLTNVKQMSVGFDNSIFLLNDGTVKATGRNDYGQFGTGNQTQQLVPTLIPGMTNVKEIASGGSSTFFLLNDGTVKVAGSNSYGQLGTGANTYEYSPIFVPGLTNVKSVYTKNSSTFFLLNDGTIKATGHNSSYQLADGTNAQKNTPVIITVN